MCKIIYPLSVAASILINVPAFMRYTSYTFEYKDTNMTMIDINVNLDSKHLFSVALM